LRALVGEAYLVKVDLARHGLLDDATAALTRTIENWIRASVALKTACQKQDVAECEHG
jgi:hypothetical protein